MLPPGKPQEEELGPSYQGSSSEKPSLFPRKCHFVGGNAAAHPEGLYVGASQRPTLTKGACACEVYTASVGSEPCPVGHDASRGHRLSQERLRPKYKVRVPLWDRRMPLSGFLVISLLGLLYQSTADWVA